MISHLNVTRVVLPMAVVLTVALSAGRVFAAGPLYTTNSTGTVVNANTNYGTARDVYISGGPQNLTASGPADGTYYFQVTDPSGKRLLSTDSALCRQLTVTEGRVVGSTGPACKHSNGTPNPINGATPVQLAPFSASPNQGSEYKAWIIPVGLATIGSDPRVLTFVSSAASTDNFKIPGGVVVTGSCQPSSSLSVLATGTNVTAYVPKGHWFDGTSAGAPGIGVTNIEGSSIIPTTIATPDVVNSCASNSTTGRTVCTANGTDVYLLSGTTLNSTLTSSGVGELVFSGGFPTNSGVAMDAAHNRAVIALSTATLGVGGYQFLDLATSLFGPVIPSPAPTGFWANISEDILVDPIRNLLLSASENNNYELVNITSSATPLFYEQAIPNPNPDDVYADSSAEDCSTGIALAPYEFSIPSQVYIADLTQAVFTPGAPGIWTAPSQIQTLTESSLPCAGPSGLAVAQGPNHTGIITDEFGCSGVTAIKLPTTSGSGVPAITDWVTCDIDGFLHGEDPHTVTAYESPNSGHSIAVLANDGATTLAVVDLTNMLNTTVVPRTGGGHVCASGSLPPTVVSLIAMP